MIERFHLGELPAQWDHLKEKEKEMALVPKKPGTEEPRPLIWEVCFAGSMFVAPHKKGSRLEFFVTLRTRSTNEEYWELSTGNNDGTGGPILWGGKDPEEGKRIAQEIVNRGE